MALVKISGLVGNFREDTKVTSVQAYNTGRARVDTKKQVYFRVGNRPVTMKDIEGIELTDGDQATVVGQDTRGGLKAILIRNDTIDMIYGYSTAYLLMWAIILTVIGVATVGILIGFIVLPLAAFLFYKAYQHKQAHQLMQDTRG